MTLPAPIGVTIGRTVAINPAVWERHRGETWFGLDQPSLRVVAQGLVPLEDGSFVHRFYSEDEIMLQLLSGRVDGADAREATVFHSLAVAPAWDPNFQASMSRATFHHADAVYGRAWFEGNDLDQPPVLLHETVHEDLSGRPARQVDQLCMLYARPLPAGGNELLLALEMPGTAGAPPHQEVMVGLELTPADIRIS